MGQIDKGRIKKAYNEFDKGIRGVFDSQYEVFRNVIEDNIPKVDIDTIISILQDYNYRVGIWNINHKDNPTTVEEAEYRLSLDKKLRFDLELVTNHLEPQKKAEEGGSYMYNSMTELPPSEPQQEDKNIEPIKYDSNDYGASYAISKMGICQKINELVNAFNSLIK